MTHLVYKPHKVTLANNQVIEGQVIEQKPEGIKLKQIMRTDTSGFFSLTSSCEDKVTTTFIPMTQIITIEETPNARKEYIIK